MKRLVKHIVITLMCFVLLVLLKNQFGYVTSGNTYGMKPLIQSKKVDNLFLGSSIFRQGLDVDVLQQNLQGSTYILTYNGNQPYFMAEELEYLIQQGVDIERLFIDMYVYTTAATPWISDTKLFLDTDLPFKLEIVAKLSQFKDFGINDFYEMFITSNMEHILTFPISSMVASTQFKDGGNLLVTKGKTSEVLDNDDFGTREKLNDYQIDGVHKIIRLCQENNIELYFLELPKYVKMVEDRREGCYLDLVQLYLEEIDNSNVLLVDYNDFDNSKGEYFQDHFHLSSEGKKVYSQILADQINLFR